MNVKQIVEEYLTAHGYDGLYDEDGECGCLKDDLFACGEGWMCECKPGYKTNCGCGDHDWRVVARREEGTNET